MRGLFALALGVLTAGCGNGSSGGGGGSGGTGGGGSGGSGGGGGAPGSSSNCPTVFPSTNAWNSDISGADVDPMSAQYIASIGAATGLHNDFDAIGDGIPYVIVPKDQKPVAVSFVDYADESDPGPYPIPDDAPVENGGDHHVIVVDGGNCRLYELFNASKTAAGWQASNGAKWDLSSDAGRTPGWTSADAAGLPIFPGLVRYDEVMSGEIKHALRFTIVNSQKGYVAPATHFASSKTDPNLPPMGLRVRLKASVDISGYPASTQVILAAMKKYGMIVADNGSNWYVSGAPDARWLDDDLAKMSKIKGSDFEVVKHGPITTQ
ncbi:MAG: hypothetical protein JWN44_724 [Myxococcales bacterium]|nr:hypothetical protein [Myxococcales bacterium]